MGKWGRASLSPAEEHRPLHGREDEVGDFITLKAFRKLLRPQASLKTVRDRTPDFVENFHQALPDVFGVGAGFGGEVAVKAAVLPA